MSSKDQHITITRENYEEYFLLYIDDELSAADRKAVETFVLLHPDLREELEQLEGTKLPAEKIIYNNKENLYSGSVREAVIDESLLLYLDGELDKDELKRVELELALNESYNDQYHSLKAVQLDANEVMVCPFKDELYRTETSKRPIPWLRIAAAVILLMGAGSVLMLNNRKAVEPPVAKVDETKKNTTTPEVKEQQTTNYPVQPSEQVIAKQEPVRSERVKIENKTTKDLPAPVQQQPDAPEDLIATVTPVEDPVATVSVTPVTSVDYSRQQNINNGAVTNVSLPSYNSIAATTAEYKSDVAGSDGKQGSVRGLLRKATRFIERRTGINPVNDDDKLLVGMVAISLK